jgi:hypothetical protein
MATSQGLVSVTKSWRAAKLMLPALLVLRNIETMSGLSAVTAKSGLPSPSRSAKETERGCSARRKVYSGSVANVAHSTAGIPKYGNTVVIRIGSYQIIFTI